jgi:hypothetical protein
MLDRKNGAREWATDRLRRGVADLAKTTGGLIAAGLDAGPGGRTRGTVGIPFHHRIAHPTTGVSPPSLDASPERFRCGLTTEVVLIQPATSPFRWGRFEAAQWDTGGTLQAKLDALYMWMEMGRRLFQSVA